MLRNSVSGDNHAYLLTGAQLKSVSNLPSELDTTWRIQAIGDFNSDGFNDIVWRRLGTSGENRIWLMNRFNVTATVTLPPVADMNWQIIGPR